MSNRRLILPVALSALSIAFSCAAGEDTVPGPESQDLVQRIDGHIVWSPLPSDQIVAIALPNGKRTIVIPSAAENDKDAPRIHSLSGPDDEGRIAYVEDHFFVENEADQRHLLKMIHLDGTGETALFSRPGDALWATSAAGKGEIGRHLALAPTGGLVAFLSGLSDKQMPRALFHRGAIEIWNVGTKERLTLNTKAIDAPMSWFPDGKRLAYVDFVERNAVPKTGVEVEVFGQGAYTGSWPELPAIYILDLASQQSRCLSLGWNPVVSADGKAIFLGGWVADAVEGIKLIWKRVDVATGAVADASWPGDAGGLIANPMDDLVLYWGLPTTGAPIKHSQDFQGLTLVNIKAAVLNSESFQTVIPEVDPREYFSFGAVKQK